MTGSGEPERFSLMFTVDVDVTDTAALRAFAVSRAESPEEITMADTNSMDALLLAVGDALLGPIPGVVEQNTRTSAYRGHILDDVDSGERGKGDNQFEETRLRRSALTVTENTVEGMLEVAKEVQGLRAEMQDAAEQVASWGLVDSGNSPGPALSSRQAEIIAGVLWQASVELIGALFDDLDSLSGNKTVKDMGGKSFGLCSLPDVYDDRYNRDFVQSFIAVCQDLSMMLVTGWRKPSCPAQDLAVLCLLAQAEAHVLDTPIAAELPEFWPDIITEAMPEGGDVGLLVGMSPEEFDREHFPENSPVRFENWFKPYGLGDKLPPYVKYWGGQAYGTDKQGAADAEE